MMDTYRSFSFFFTLVQDHDVLMNNLVLVQLVVKETYYGYLQIAILHKHNVIATFTGQFHSRTHHFHRRNYFQPSFALKFLNKLCATTNTNI